MNLNEDNSDQIREQEENEKYEEMRKYFEDDPKDCYTSEAEDNN